MVPSAQVTKFPAVKSAIDSHDAEIERVQEALNILVQRSGIGGGNGGGGGMAGSDAEIAALKVRADHADRELSRINDKADAIASGVTDLRFQISDLGKQFTLESTRSSAHVTAELASIKSGIASKDTVRNWGLAIIASLIGLAALMVSMQSNMLSSFQAGLSVVQAVVGAGNSGSANNNVVTPPSAAQPSRPE
jgi:hypothetical protein